jgi:hypothetical protein
LQWCRENGCPWNNECSERAANSGHLEVLRWLRAEGAPWTVDVCAYAALNGHLEVLKWAKVGLHKLTIARKQLVSTLEPIQ